MTDQPDLREVISDIIGEDVYEYADNCDGLSIADKILAIPRIANALKLTVVKTMGEK
jgi:hypothetical protein